MIPFSPAFFGQARAALSLVTNSAAPSLGPVN
jgi:hypothetical protein